MTTFYGFPKANTGVMPECAKTHKVCIVWSANWCTFTPFNVDEPNEWSDINWDDKLSIAAYFETDIELDSIL